MSNKNKQRRRFNLEIPIVILIAFLVLILMKFADQKLEELIASEAEIMFTNINHDPNDEMHKELADKISSFRPDVCKMIEIYNVNMELLIRVQFEEDKKEYANNIKDYPELVDLLMNHDDGHTNIEIDDSSEYVYFQWSDNTAGERFLFIIYTYKPVVEYLWVFHLLCYAILMLVCSLLTILSLRGHSERIRYYRELTTGISR